MTASVPAIGVFQCPEEHSMSMDVHQANVQFPATSAFQCPEEHSMSMDLGHGCFCEQRKQLEFQCPEEHSMSMDTRGRCASPIEQGWVSVPRRAFDVHGPTVISSPAVPEARFQCPEEHSMSMDHDSMDQLIHSIFIFVSVPRRAFDVHGRSSPHRGQISCSMQAVSVPRRAFDVHGPS